MYHLFCQFKQVLLNGMLICLALFYIPSPLYAQNMSRWITESLLPEKSAYTLKDIVIPGSHDAGMSVLFETGGSQKSTINECNTLTQTKSIEKQIKEGIRMFDLRTGVLRDTIFLKHSSSDCMDMAIGGGYGERLEPVLHAAKSFLTENPGEFLIFGFSHFCPKEMAVDKLASEIIRVLGKEHVYLRGNKGLQDITIGELSGKVLLAFESDSFSNEGIVFNSMINTTSSSALNFRRAYAATNKLDKLLSVQIAFFKSMDVGVGNNDLIRLDWQLTQSPQEAAMVCNAFESDKNSPIFDGGLLVANLLTGAKSILAHAKRANKVLPSKLDKWINDGTIHQKNKPNILYVDAAGDWITKYCIQLNNSPLYKK